MPSEMAEIRVNEGRRENILKAAGTLMMSALPLIVVLRLTLFPREASAKASILESLSPTLIKLRAEPWNERVEREELSARRRRTKGDAIVCIIWFRFWPFW